MEKILTILLLSFVCCSFSFAQNVDIPDQNLKQFLLKTSPDNTYAKDLNGVFFAIDTNGDSEIQVSEAEQVTYLDLSEWQQGVKSVEGLEQFSSLKFLDMRFQYPTEVELVNMPNLETVHLPKKSTLKNVIITDNPKLTKVRFDKQDWFNTPLENLVKVDLSRNKLTDVDFFDGDEWYQHDFDPQYLDFSDNELSGTFKESASWDNYYLNISNNNIEFVDIDLVSSHEIQVIIDNNPIKKLVIEGATDEYDFSQFTDIESIILKKGKFKNITLHNLSKLKELNLSESKVIENVNLKNLPLLDNIDFTESFPSISYDNLKFESISLEVNDDERKMQNIVFKNMPNLQSVSLMKGGRYERLLGIPSLELTNNPILKKVDLDELLVFKRLVLKDLQELNSINIKYVGDLSVDGLDKLKSINVLLEKHNSSGLSEVNISNCQTLESIKIENNNSYNNDFDVNCSFENLPSVVNIDLEDFGLHNELNISNFASLKSIDLNNLYFYKSPIFSDLPSLESFSLKSSEFEEGLSLKITDFEKLKTLNFVSGNYNLEYADYFPPSYYVSDPDYLVLQDLPVLSSLTLNNIDTQKISFSNLPIIDEINLENIYSTDIKIERCQSLSTLQSTKFLGFDSFDINNLNALTKIEFASLKTPSDIDIQNLPKLDSLIFHHQSSKFEKVNLRGLPSLSYLNLQTLGKYENDNALIPKFHLKDFPSLKTVILNLDNFDSLDLKFDLPSLETLNISTKSCSSSIDITESPNVRDFQLNPYRSGKPPRFLGLKNGNDEYDNFYMSVYEASKIEEASICIDSDAEKELILSQQSNIPQASFTTSCESIVPSNFVSGQVFIDEQGNGCSSGARSVAMHKIDVEQTDDDLSVYTNQNGEYQLYTDVLNTDIKLIPAIDKSYYSSSPNEEIITFSEYGSEKNINFCLSPNGDKNDLEIFATAVNQSRPGFKTNIILSVVNNGTITQSGEIELLFDDQIQSYLSSDINPLSNTDGVLKWEYSELKPFDKLDINLFMELNKPTDSNPLNGGEILKYECSVDPVNNDETESDNSFVLTQTVVNSYDPNDITCHEGQEVLEEVIGEYVHYTIRFENIGTANAENIVIKNFINENQFDVSTLTPLSGSHDFQTLIEYGNEVKFIFDNIQLPFDDANNDGYITYKVKTLTSLQLGDVFDNSAEIYFDYNFPIYTNQFDTEIVNQTTVDVNEISLIDLSIYPNPCQDLIVLKSEDGIESINIINQQGQLMSKFVFSNQVFKKAINVSELPKGIYYINVFSNGKSTVKKLLKL